MIYDHTSSRLRRIQNVTLVVTILSAAVAYGLDVYVGAGHRLGVLRYVALSAALLALACAFVGRRLSGIQMRQQLAPRALLDLGDRGRTFVAVQENDGKLQLLYQIWTIDEQEGHDCLVAASLLLRTARQFEVAGLTVLTITRGLSGKAKHLHVAELERLALTLLALARIK